MEDTDTLFKRLKINMAQLVPFGFSESGGVYAHSTGLIRNQFELIVTVTQTGEVATKVIDRLSGDRYVLHLVPGAKGAFVGTVREEYEAVLAAIAAACSEPDVFKSEGARQVIHYVREKYHDELQFLWERFSDNAIYRRQDNAKWYAAMLIVQKKKLGLDAEGAVEIVDLRGEPEMVSALVDGKNYFPGYHMNKKHWFTIILDGSVSIEEIFGRIDESFALAGKQR